MLFDLKLKIMAQLSLVSFVIKFNINVCMSLNLDFLRFQYFKESQDLQLVVGMIIVNPTQSPFLNCMLYVL